MVGQKRQKHEGTRLRKIYFSTDIVCPKEKNLPSSTQMKLTISLCILFFSGTTMAFPQSSFYAGNRKETYPKVLSRFGGDDTNVDSRFGETNPSTSSVVPTNTRTDSLQDPDVVSRVATWPKERQPFWYLNSLHINSQRGQNVPCSNCVNQESLQQPLPQSPFAQRN